MICCCLKHMCLPIWLSFDSILLKAHHSLFWVNLENILGDMISMIFVVFWLYCSNTWLTFFLMDNWRTEAASRMSHHTSQNMKHFEYLLIWNKEYLMHGNHKFSKQRKMEWMCKMCCLPFFKPMAIMLRWEPLSWLLSFLAVNYAAVQWLVLLAQQEMHLICVEGASCNEMSRKDLIELSLWLLMSSVTNYWRVCLMCNSFDFIFW